MRRWRAVLAGACGQSSVELLGLVPLCLLVTLAVGEGVGAGMARGAAGAAAQAGAMAIVQGGDPVRSARAAAPVWARSRLAVRLEGRRVMVRVAPVTLVPGTSSLLVARAVADAGPAA